MGFLFTTVFLFALLNIFFLKKRWFGLDIAREVVFIIISMFFILTYKNTHVVPIIFPIYLGSLLLTSERKIFKYLFIPAATLPFAEYYFWIIENPQTYSIVLNYITCIPIAIVIIVNIQTQSKKNLTTYLFLVCAFLASGYWSPNGYYLALATVGLYTVVKIVEYTIARNTSDAPDYIYLDRWGL